MAASLLTAACSDTSPVGDDPSAITGQTVAGSEGATTDDGRRPEPPTGSVRDFGPGPEIPTGDLDPVTLDAVEVAFGERLRSGEFGPDAVEAVRTIGASGDPRTAWWLTDLLRISSNPDLVDAIGEAYTELTGVDLDPFGGWGDAVDHLLAWDVPAPPDYLTYKRNVYLLVEPRWEPLFPDESDIDWRLVSWGGVLIDDRPYGETDVPCNCIPAADNPVTTDAARGDEWLDDTTIVFGVEIEGEARAYPRATMEVREMVNDTLGGRDFAMPYCTLCGAAQVFFTDGVVGFERPILRTSGLLSRSNKVMYDIRTSSVFDTFLGAAVSGPLWEAGVVLPQYGVVTTTWGQWRSEHPDTTVLHIDEALGRPGSNLRDTRDGDGPIFPIGDVDPRLAVQEDVLGLFTSDGEPIAFHVASALDALERGETISIEGIDLILDGGGLRAVDADGNDLGGHQAFWFAWSQFHPGTALWPEARS
ncbi:MAG: DUF3179 domain-containing (seleno)protein [Acidimicrobiales bacterium]